VIEFKHCSGHGSEEYCDQVYNLNLHLVPSVQSWWKEKNVLLAKLCEDGQGWIFVKNISYEKKIRIVYTLNNWKNRLEMYAEYLKTLVGTGIEVWHFILPIGNTKFAIEYTHNEGIDWDNNYGSDYQLTDSFSHLIDEKP